MNNTEERYRQEWAAKSGRLASEVYVPEALRTRTPLKAGDRIRILVDRLSAADVEAGDVLEVVSVYGDELRTNAPTLTHSPYATWSFWLSDEGSGWERE